MVTSAATVGPVLRRETRPLSLKIAHKEQEEAAGLARDVMGTAGRGWGASALLKQPGLWIFSVRSLLRAHL